MRKMTSVMTALIVFSASMFVVSACGGSDVNIDDGLPGFIYRTWKAEYEDV